MTVIGLTGWAQHGKDSVGAFLREKYGYVRYAFADQLKDLALIVNPIVPVTSKTMGYEGMTDHLETLATLVARVGWDEAKKEPEVRRILQDLGTGVRDIIGATAWVQALDDKLLREAEPRAVITDVRFHNEADYIHRNGGLLIRVTRYVRTAEGIITYDNGIGLSHASEAEVANLPADFDLANIDGEFPSTLATLDSWLQHRDTVAVLR